MTGPLAASLAASMAVVALYCLARSFLPALRTAEHRRDVDAWHVAMGGAMAAMLVAPDAKSFSVVSLGVFAAGVGYSLVQVARRISRAAYVRLGVGCAAMTAMLLPPATASAASASTGTASAGMASMGMASMGMAGMSHSMPGMQMDATAAPAGRSTAAFPTLLVTGLTVAVCLLVVVRLLHSVRRSRPVGERLDAFCEAAMAGAMGYLLLLMS